MKNEGKREEGGKEKVSRLKRLEVDELAQRWRIDGSKRWVTVAELVLNRAESKRGEGRERGGGGMESRLPLG